MKTRPDSWYEEDPTRGRSKEMSRALMNLGEALSALDTATVLFKTAVVELVILSGKEIRAARGIPEDEHANPASDSSN